MRVKTFSIRGYSNIQSEIQNWLYQNPGINILGMSQSAIDINEDVYTYVITIIYY